MKLLKRLFSFGEVQNESIAGPDSSTELRALALIEQGNALENSGRLTEALPCYEAAVQVAPGLARAHLNHGNALLDQGQTDEALAAYGTAIKLRPEYAPAQYGLGNALLRRGDLESALVAYGRAIALKQDFTDAYVAQGAALEDLGRHHEALASYGQALAIDPDHADAHFCDGVCRLATGDLLTGWRQHEWRWKSSVMRGARRDLPFPLWMGEAQLQGKTILLHAEQGLGDAIQFSRYASLVAEQGARVILGVQPPLASLLSRLRGVNQVITHNQALPDVDFHTPLMSLPLAFKTDLLSIPAVPGYITPDPDEVDAWKDRLGPKTDPRIGLVWSGNAQQKNDHNRSIPLAKLTPILSGNFEFISLQKEVRPDDMLTLSETRAVLHLGDELVDFEKTAGLVENLDLVITVCTSVAHLAAAMGKPVWVLLAFNPCWRWMRDRSDSPWYPSMRLFRQPSPGAWESVIASLRDELEAWRPTAHQP